MAEKHPNPREWGGPGSSEQNARKPPPEPVREDGDPPLKPGPHSDERSHVSGGGGELDDHHTHDPVTKS